jgi:hypothetical protein
MVVVRQFAMLTELDGLTLHDEGDQLCVDVTVNEKKVTQTPQLDFIEAVVHKHPPLEMRAAFVFDRAPHRWPSAGALACSLRVLVQGIPESNVR